MQHSLYVELSNGLKIPILGLGTSHGGGYSHDAVVCALQQCGIRHIDTAKRYGCEEALSKSIEESRVPRDELWITTKLWPGDYGYQSAKEACRASCARLGVEYVDLYLMHWPDCAVPGRSNRDVRAETWRALEEMYDEGLCRSIGVSNFLIPHLEGLKEDGGVVPHVNQVEFHPFQQPWQLVEFCHKEGVAFEGYCPLAKGQALDHPLILELAQKYGRSASQICIRWSIQNRVITIPKSTKPARVHENCQVFGFQLEDADMAAMRALHDGRHVSWDPIHVESSGSCWTNRTWSVSGDYMQIKSSFISATRCGAGNRDWGIGGIFWEIQDGSMDVCPKF